MCVCVSVLVSDANSTRRWMCEINIFQQIEKERKCVKNVKCSNTIAIHWMNEIRCYASVNCKLENVESLDVTVVKYVRITFWNCFILRNLKVYLKKTTLNLRSFQLNNEFFIQFLSKQNHFRFNASQLRLKMEKCRLNEWRHCFAIENGLKLNWIGLLRCVCEILLSQNGMGKLIKYRLDANAKWTS